ncbi:MAG: hypothetical protein JSR59_05765 [Proteobacteria bacterium]|nr:hypothetical protein [Pseudomonadota bacterium]
MSDSPAITRTETHGAYVMRGSAAYLIDVQLWEAKVTIERSDGSVRPFAVPCGPECYRKNGDDALRAAWAAARQWLDGGRIPWRTLG